MIQWLNKFNRLDVLDETAEIIVGILKLLSSLYYFVLLQTFNFVLLQKG